MWPWEAGLNKVAFGDPVTWDVTEVVVGTGALVSAAPLMAPESSG